jgi:multidrug efflux pump subunit AcrA (membrane-fusion protein)
LVLLVTGAGIAAFVTLTFSKTRPGRHKAPTAAMVVEVVEARAVSVPMVVNAMGGVQSAQTVKIVPQVGGKVTVVSPNLIPGGRVKKGELLVQIEAKDYDLAIRASQAEVTQAKLAVEIQEGQRAAARRELQLIDGELAPTQEGLRLASRESYVENARAQLDAAMSRLEQAQLARRRTALHAPFDARVQDKLVDVGQVVTPQSVLATVVSSSQAWVEAALPTEQLRWIEVPGLTGERGAAVRVRQQLAGDVEIVRRGEVLGLLPSLHERGKLARLLIGIDDPFAEQRVDGAASRPADEAPSLPLLAGAFVHLEIEGRTLPDLIALPRGGLREGGEIWVRDADGLLAVRAVEVVWREEEVVYVRGDVRPREQIITSHIVSPIPGMKLTASSEPAPRVGQRGPGETAPVATPP